MIHERLGGFLMMRAKDSPPQRQCPGQVFFALVSKAKAPISVADGRLQCRLGFGLVTETVTQAGREIVEELANGIIRSLGCVGIGRADQPLQ